MDTTIFRLKKVWSSIKVPVSLILLTMPAWLPFLRSSSLPCTHDNAFHYFRMTAMRDALRHGWLFSRWMPNLALGYGYPFFNYREPLPYLVGEFLYVAGLPLPFILGAFYALSIILAAWGSYVLSRDVFGRRAGWVGAVTYAMAPYVLMDANRRGNLPESIALALLPWIFVHFRRLILSGRKKEFIKSTVLLVILFLSHNISSLLLVPFLGGFVVFSVVLLRKNNRTWYWAFVAVGLAVLLTAWFWLPAIFEQDMVQLNLSYTTRNNDFHYNFISWSQILFELPQSYDAHYLNPPMVVHLGIGQGLLALTGMVAALFLPRTKEQRGVILLSITFVLVYLWMCTSSSLTVWETLPLLSFVQFPWRFVGRALLPASLLAASVFSSIQGKKGSSNLDDSQSHNDVENRAGILHGFNHHNTSTSSGNIRVVPNAILSIVIVLLILSAYPGTYPPKGTCSNEPYPDIADVTAYELQGWLGMDPEQSYFPVWVKEHPSEATLAEAFANGKIPERLDMESLPQDVEVISAKYRVLSALIRINASQPFRARWKGLYFPGWKVRIDGKQVPITPEEGTGLITFEVPAGEHSLAIRFASTPVRTAGNLFLFVGLSIFAFLMLRKSLISQGSQLAGTVPDMTPVGNIIVVLAVVLLLVKFVVVDNTVTPIRQSRIREDRLPEVENILHQGFDNNVEISGYTIHSSVLPGDGEIQIDLLWQASGIPEKEFHTVILVIGPDGQVWSHAGTLRPSGYEVPPPKNMWGPGDYTFDPHIISLLPGTPPGIYQLEVVMIERDTMQPISVLNRDGSLGAPAYRLASIEVTRPEKPFTLKSLGVDEDTEAQSCGAVKLLSMTLDRSEAAPGDIFAVRWVWEMLDTGGEKREYADLYLVDPDGHVIHEWELPLSTDWWPSSSWQPDERWVGNHVVRIPVDIMGGTYRITSVINECSVPLSTTPLKIKHIDRVYEMPVHLTPVDAQFGGIIQLSGYAVRDANWVSGETISLNLAWQALAPVEMSYRVFLHLVDSEGRVVDQDDGEPASWSRPTTGWVPGEVVTETRTLSLPEIAGEVSYAVNVGLYGGDGTRLALPSGEDTFVLFLIQVNP